MKAAKTAAILAALPLLLTCGLFSGPNDRENPFDPQNPNYSPRGQIVDSVNDVGKYASMKASANNIFISYFDETSDYTKFASSSNGGGTWTTKQVVFSANINGNPSAIAIRPKGLTFDISLIYQDLVNLRARKSSDSGAIWSTTAMSPDIANTVLNQCSLAAGTGTDDYYYASYYAYNPTAGYNQLWFAKTTLGGTDWTAGVPVTTNPSQDVGNFNSITVYENNVFIAYRNNVTSKIMVTSSFDWGATWFQLKEVGTSTATILGGTAIAAMDPTKVFVVYFDGTNLSFTKSTDTGVSFSAPQTIDTGAGISPSIAISGGKIYVSHFDSSNGYLRFTRSDDLGTTWISPSVIVDIGLGANKVGKSTSIAVDGATVYIAYYDTTNQDLKIVKSLDNGDTW